VSFAFNLGITALGRSTLLKKVNINPTDPTIAAEFAKWNKAGGKILNGLTKRRAKEAKLYFA
jgi:lysozyme